MALSPDDIEWSTLSHAYGPATDVPDMLRALQDADTAEAALDELSGTVFHQGSVYTATPPTAVFLARLAADPATPARSALAAFVAELGADLVADHATPDALGVSGRYLPPGLDLDAFTRTARAAYDEACIALRPCLDNDDAAVRAAVANAWRVLDPVPDDLASALRGRLRVERDAAALGTIAGTLAGAGLLTEAERSALATAPKDARFLAARLAAQSKRPLDPCDLATLRTLWVDVDPTIRPDLQDLLELRGPELLPLLDDLATRPEPGCRVEAIAAYRKLTRVSRGATDAAVAGLLGLAARLAEAPTPAAVEDRVPDAALTRLAEARTLTGAMRELFAHQPDPAAIATRARRDLADALTELLVTDRDGSLADALVALAGDDPDLRAKAAGALLDADDDRWAMLVSKAAATGEPVPWIVPLMFAAARRSGEADALAGALEFLRGALRRDPAGTASHIWALHDLPDTATRPLMPEVVAALPFAVRAACRLLGRWQAPETAAPLRHVLATVEPDDRAWVHAALGAVTGDARELDRGWAARAERWFDAHGYLEQWSLLPTELFRQACRQWLTGALSYPEACEQVLACRLMLPFDGLAGVWPTLRALIDGGDRQMHEALKLAIDALDAAVDAPRRADLVALLEDIRVNGRRTPLGAALDAPVIAATGLHALGAGDAAALAETCLVALRATPRLWLAAATPPRACALLTDLATADESIRRATCACYAELLAADRRVGFGVGARVAEDEAFRGTLRRAAAALQA